MARSSKNQVQHLAGRLLDLERAVLAFRNSSLSEDLDVWGNKPVRTLVSPIHPHEKSVTQYLQFAEASDFLGSKNGIGTTVQWRFSLSLSTSKIVPDAACSDFTIASAMFFSSLGE